jgi:glycosyltransferase involved in cell wall biosynthesis
MLPKKIDIVIPAHNEDLNLNYLLPKIVKIIKSNKLYKFRLVLIDDKSEDTTLNVIKNFKKKNSFIRIIKNKNKSGQTICYKKYLQNFTSDYFIRIDADNQDNPKYLKKMISLVKKNFDVILAKRTIRKHSLYMIILTFLYDKLIYFLIKEKLETYSSSLGCFKRSYLSFTNLRYNDHRYFPLIAINNGARKIKIFKTIHQKRKFGESKYKIINKIFFAVPEFLFFYFRMKKGDFN